MCATWCPATRGETSGSACCRAWTATSAAVRAMPPRRRVAAPPLPLPSLAAWLSPSRRCGRRCGGMESRRRGRAAAPPTAYRLQPAAARPLPAGEMSAIMGPSGSGKASWGGEEQQHSAAHIVSGLGVHGKLRLSPKGTGTSPPAAPAPILGAQRAAQLATSPLSSRCIQQSHCGSP